MTNEFEQAALAYQKSSLEWQQRYNIAIAERDEARRELETERMRLAACGVAALGYFNGCEDAYKSASLDDVLRLRAEGDALRKLLRLCARTCDTLDHGPGKDFHAYDEPCPIIPRIDAALAVQP
jgi:hypothetical protein